MNLVLLGVVAYDFYLRFDQGQPEEAKWGARETLAENLHIIRVTTKLILGAGDTPTIDFAGLHLGIDCIVVNVSV